MAYSGRYDLINPKKYKGDPSSIWWRSLWERNVMVNLDTWDEVIDWSSEEIVIPYRSPIDGKIHRYFPDFWCRIKTPDGTIENLLIEVKPKAQTIEPKKPKRITKRFVSEVMEWGKNNAKWEAAKEFCADKGWSFQIMTEDDIFGKKG